MSFESYQSDTDQQLDLPEQQPAREFVVPEKCLRHMLDIVMSESSDQSEKDQTILELDAQEHMLVASVPPGFALSCLARDCQTRYMVRRLSSKKPLIHSLTPDTDAACIPEAEQTPILNRQNRGH